MILVTLLDAAVPLTFTYCNDAVSVPDKFVLAMFPVSKFATRIIPFIAEHDGPDCAK